MDRSRLPRRAWILTLALVAVAVLGVVLVRHARMAAAGIMLGTPMAGDKFPDGVAFRPYGYLRNTTDRPLKVDLGL